MKRIKERAQSALGTSFAPAPTAALATQPLSTENPSAHNGSSLAVECTLPSSAAIAAPASLAPVLVRAHPGLLTLQVRLPSPDALPPVDSMSPHDCLRELMSVACQRDAETAAATSVFERSQQQSHHQQQQHHPHAQLGSSLRRYPPLPASAVKAEAPGKRAGDAPGDALTGSVAVAAYSCGSALAPTQSSVTGEYDVTCCDGLSVTARVARLPPTHVDVASAVAAAVESATLHPGDAAGSDGGSVAAMTLPAHVAADGSARPAVQLSVHIPAALAPLLAASSGNSSDAIASATGVLAFHIPRKDVLANVPVVGPAPAADAVTALKSLLRAAAQAAAVSSPETLAAQLLSSSEPPLDGEAGAAVVRLLRSFCRVWPHAQLTPAQSQLRVQALVGRVRETGAYEVTPPVPPLAPTRLGSGHVPLAHTSPALHASGSTGTGAAALGFFSPSAPSGPAAAHHVSEGAVFAGTQTIAVAHGGAGSGGGDPHHPGLHAGGFTTPTKAAGGGLRGAAAAGTGVPVTPVVLGSSSRPGRPMVTFTFAPSAAGAATGGFKSPAARAKAVAAASSRRFGAGSPARHPAASPSSSSSSATLSNYGAPRVLARYVDGVMDCTRGGVSPAAFDREAHRGVLQKLEMGLQAMSHQRRQEEEHMREATGVKPAKHPKGGYWYQDLHTRELRAHKWPPSCHWRCDTD